MPVYVAGPVTVNVAFALFVETEIVPVRGAGVLTKRFVPAVK